MELHRRRPEQRLHGQNRVAAPRSQTTSHHRFAGTTSHFATKLDRASGNGWRDFISGCCPSFWFLDCKFHYLGLNIHWNAWESITAISTALMLPYLDTGRQAGRLHLLDHRRTSASKRPATDRLGHQEPGSCCQRKIRRHRCTAYFPQTISLGFIINSLLAASFE